MKIDVFELLDKPSKKEQRWKETFLVISFTWLLSMAFLVQFVVEQEIIVDIFSNTKRLKGL